MVDAIPHQRRATMRPDPRHTLPAMIGPSSICSSESHAQAPEQVTRPEVAPTRAEATTDGRR
jgi:hypothetical protein